MNKKAVHTERAECPIKPQFRDAMDRLIAYSVSAAVQKLQAARAAGSDGDKVEAAPPHSKDK